MKQIPVVHLIKSADDNRYFSNLRLYVNKCQTPCNASLSAIGYLLRSPPMYTQSTNQDSLRIRACQALSPLIRRLLKIATRAKSGCGRTQYTCDRLMEGLVIEVNFLVSTEFRACLGWLASNMDMNTDKECRSRCRLEPLQLN
jgi:hypothetical protein